MVSGTDWFNNKSQFAIFQNTLERSRMQVKLAAAKRMEAETAKLNEKYDGKKAAALQEQGEKLGDERMEVSAYNDRVEAALKKFNDVRVSLLSALDAANQGSSTAFDLAINTQNAWLGNKTTFPDSLVANTANGYGTWKQSQDMVAGGGLDTVVRQHFIGNDYVIKLDSGETLHTNKNGDKLEGGPNGAVAMSDWQVDSLTGDQITVTDTANGATYTGTLKRGGLGVLNAWGYNGFATQADTDRAKADIKAAMKNLDKFELDFRNSQNGLQAILGSMDSKIQNLTDEYTKVANEELDAKQAERKAIKTKFDIQTNALAITTGMKTNMIYQLFRNPMEIKKRDLTDIMLDMVKG